MKKIWKYTAILTLILIGTMQAVSFIPVHESCQAACCVQTTSCCETEMKTGCDMAMTSCNVSLFIPLLSAPLIKVESVVHLDMAVAPSVNEELLWDKFQIDTASLIRIQKATPASPHPAPDLDIF